MSNRIQAVRGMPDVLPDMTPLWQHVEALWLKLMRSYGYEEIRLPILEKTNLFKRSIGEVTDIVEKEMFTFLDRDNESITLRPEGTAGCIRSGLENGLLHNQTQRLWYAGPMFRYEKPQKGRYRQFTQFGVEAFGLEGPDIDVEQLLMMYRFLKQLGVSSVVSLQINSLGSQESRLRYREALVTYFEGYQQSLDEDSKRRLTTNPLRILDSKNPALADIISAAPQSRDYLASEDKQHFETFQTLLSDLSLPFTVNPCLVRGIDYYNRSVYEWVTDQLGAQGTVCAGGRYDPLVEFLGGRPSPGVGFAMGVERLILLAQTVMVQKEAVLDIYCVCKGLEAKTKAFIFAEELRDDFPQLKIITNSGEGDFKQQFKRADKAKAKLAFIFGEEELKNRAVSIKFLREERSQITLTWDKIPEFIENYFSNHFSKTPEDVYYGT